MNPMYRFAQQLGDAQHREPFLDGIAAVADGDGVRVTVEQQRTPVIPHTSDMRVHVWPSGLDFQVSDRDAGAPRLAEIADELPW